MSNQEDKVLVRVSARLTVEDYQELRRLAEEDDRSVMNYVGRLIEAHLAAQAAAA